MCGIAAIFSYSTQAPPVNEDELIRIRDRMITRGPDDSGVWLSADRRIGLAHRRLSIIDLSEAGHQPMSSADSRLHVVFNGEIYNYRKLRADLEAQGAMFRSHSDTEVLLHLYERKGPDFVSDLRGMYALALWDAKEQTLLLARDPLGIKPLYYADDGKTIRIASQVKALQASPSISKKLEPAGVVGFHLWGYVPDPYTLFRDIRALPAGSLLVISKEKGVTPPQSFYHLPFQDIATASSEPSKLTLRESLLGSVSRHLESDVPVGIFLSSGLDSATLTALSSEITTKPLHTVTLGFDELKGTAGDEVPLAERLASHYGTQHRTVRITKKDFETDLSAILAAMDEPSIDGVNTYFVSKAAAQAGLKVALSGLGGDELFGGYPSFKQIPRLVRAARPARYVPGLGKAFRWISSRWLGRFTSPKYAGLLEYGGSTAGAYLLRRGLYMPWELPSFLDADLVREGWRALQPLAALDRIVDGIHEARWQISALEMSCYMRGQLLRDADWAGMAHSLEIRVPLVDSQLLSDLVPLFKRGPAMGKQAMALTPSKPLPPEVLSRPKTGFSVPIYQWILPRGSATNAQGLRKWSRMIFEELSA